MSPRRLLLFVTLTLPLAGSVAHAAATSAMGAWRQLPTVPGNSFGSCDYDTGRDRMMLLGGMGTSVQSDIWLLANSPVVDWQVLHASGTVPFMFFPAHIVDPVRDRWVLFGGQGAPADTVYTLSLSGTPTWSALSPAGTPFPDPREGAAAIYDPKRDRMVMFGGVGFGAGLHGYVNEVRALDLVSPAWSVVSVTGSAPGPRAWTSAVYDSRRDALVLFGGADSSSVYDEVWTMNLAGTAQWRRVTTSGTPPAARWLAGAMYDSLEDRLIVTCGERGAPGYETPTNDTWALSLGTGEWTLLAASGPRLNHYLGYAADVRGRRLLVDDGSTSTGPVAGGVSHYTSSYSLDTNSWTLLAGDPYTRIDESLVADPDRDRILDFGGGTNETWSLDMGVDMWRRLAPGGTPPPPRSGASAILDSTRGRVIVFGGSGLSDTWALSLSPLAWTSVPTTGTSPGGRNLHVAVYDPLRDRMLAVGGGSDDDVYALDLATSVWSKIPVLGPAAPGVIGGIYDPLRDRLVVVVGNGLGTPALWALSLSGTPAWSLLPAADAPTAEGYWSCVYDPARDRMILYGGAGLYHGSMTYAIPLASPQWIALAPSPASLYGHSRIVGDPTRDRVLMHGGVHCSGLGSCDYMNLTYELSFAGETPVLLSLFEANPVAEGIELRWQFGDPGRVTATRLERRAGPGAWAPLDVAIQRRGEFEVAFDSGVIAGERYEYRLRATLTDGSQAVLGTATAQGIGSIVVSSIESVSPNPASRRVSIAFALAADGPMRLTLVDVAGREVSRLADGVRARGRYTVLWDGTIGGRPAAPGIYWARLSVPGHTAIRRLAIAR